MLVVMRTRLARLLLAATRGGPATAHRSDVGGLEAAVNARIVPAGWRDEARDAHGMRIEVGDRLRWISQPGETPGRNPEPGATGYAKAIGNHAHVQFWLDEPTGDGPGGQYWDTNPWRLERL